MDMLIQPLDEARAGGADLSRRQLTCEILRKRSAKKTTHFFTKILSLTTILLENRQMATADVYVCQKPSGHDANSLPERLSVAYYPMLTIPAHTQQL